MKKLREEREMLIESTRAPLTAIGYASDWSLFTRWCKSTGRRELPASQETVELYLTDVLQTRKVSTARRHLSAILNQHTAQHQPTPDSAACRRILTGARRIRKERPTGKKALDPSDLRRISRKLDTGTNRGLRDRAILVLGFASGLRRSNLAMLDIADTTTHKKGIILEIRSSKTDTEGKGATLGIFSGSRPETCPKRTIAAWIKARGRQPGPLFTRIQTGDLITTERMTGEAINEIVQRGIASIGLNAAQYGAHSLRAGMCTAAAEAGATTHQIMTRSLHTQEGTVKDYIRRTAAAAFPPYNLLAKAL